MFPEIFHPLQISRWFPSALESSLAILPWSKYHASINSYILATIKTSLSILSFLYALRATTPSVQCICLKSISSVTMPKSVCSYLALRAAFFMSTLSSSRALRATVQTIHISILSNNTAIYIYCLRSGASLVHLKLKFLTCHDCIVILYPNLPICIHNLMLWVLIYILVNLSSYVIAHFVVMSWTLLILYAYKFVKLNTLLKLLCSKMLVLLSGPETDGWLNKVLMFFYILQFDFDLTCWLLKINDVLYNEIVFLPPCRMFLRQHGPLLTVTKVPVPPLPTLGLQ